MTDTTTITPVDTLTAEEKAIIHAAFLSWRRRRAAAMELGLTPTRMAQRTLQLIDDPRSQRELPTLVRMLRQLRAKKAAARTLR
ncbi:DUF3263 domain-containing protein [Naumannella sp. ID2617S]|nr:DUF3263 domain-containing protein [Naumannella sp. ID2617S]